MSDAIQPAPGNGDMRSLLASLVAGTAPGVMQGPQQLNPLGTQGMRMPVGMLANVSY
jgi:hypothetical protein